MTPSEVLEATADTIEKYGHCRGQMGDKKRGFCVVGGFDHVLPLPHTTQEEIEDGHRAYHALGHKVAVMAGKPVPVWSDSAPTQEVLDTLRSAAKELRLEEEGIR